MKALSKIVVLVAVFAALVSCHDKSEPNYQYFPNMYQSVAYEPYQESGAFANGKEGQMPVKGTIPRGFTPYEYANTEEGYEQSKANLKSPLDSTQVNMDKAKDLYTIYCAICHGDKGDGKGNLAKREKFAGVPNYKDRVITEGSVFHVETYGRNMMGSYANQLSQDERWMVARYVMKLKSE